MAKVMIASVYDAFLAANVGDEKARAAAQDLAGYASDFHGIERQMDQMTGRLDAMDTNLSWMKWIIGANTALVAGVLVKLFLQ